MAKLGDDIYSSKMTKQQQQQKNKKKRKKNKQKNKKKFSYLKPINLLQPPTTP